MNCSLIHTSGDTPCGETQLTSNISWLCDVVSGPRSLEHLIDDHETKRVSDHSNRRTSIDAALSDNHQGSKRRKSNTPDDNIQVSAAGSGIVQKGYYDELVHRAESHGTGAKRLEGEGHGRSGEEDLVQQVKSVQHVRDPGRRGDDGGHTHTAHGYDTSPASKRRRSVDITEPGKGVYVSVVLLRVYYECGRHHFSD